MAATSPIIQSYPSEFQRPGLTVVDPDASAVPQVTLGPAKGFRIGASCATPNATLGLRLYLLDSAGRVISVMAVTFTTGNAPDWGTTYIGTPGVESWWPTLGAMNMAIKVDAISAGSTWAVAGAWGEA